MGTPVLSNYTPTESAMVSSTQKQYEDDDDYYLLLMGINFEPSPTATIRIHCTRAGPGLQACMRGRGPTWLQATGLLIRWRCPVDCQSASWTCRQKRQSNLQSCAPWKSNQACWDTSISMEACFRHDWSTPWALCKDKLAQLIISTSPRRLRIKARKWKKTITATK